MIIIPHILWGKNTRSICALYMLKIMGAAVMADLVPTAESIYCVDTVSVSEDLQS